MAADTSWHVALQFAAEPSAWVAVFLPLSLSLVLVVRAACRGQFPVWLAVAWMACVALSQALSTWVIGAELRSLHVASIFTIAVVVAAYLRVRMDLGLVFGLTHLALLLVDVVEAARYAAVNDEFTRGFFVGIGGAGLFDGLLLFPAATTAALAYSGRRHRRHRQPSARSAALGVAASEGP